ncbi:MAG: twin-arginine translocase subunit TatC [Neisseriales bacterium]|nr:MAG: twin-arginine translocase subunit TatC [Neisseriales bacterium]
MNNMDQVFITHLIELRKRIIVSGIGFFIIFISLFPFSNKLYQLLANPIGKFLPKNSQLIATDITSPFFVPLKLTAIVAFIICLPLIIFQLWKFIAPGLYQQEKKLLSGTIASSFILFIAGIIFCYFLVLPAIFHFIGSVKPDSITMLTDIGKYLDFVLTLAFTFGLAFETPVIIFLLIRFGFLSITTATKIRPYMLVGAFVIAAIVTPPDILSQTMLAIPLYLLYELGVITAKIFIKQNPKT